MKFQKQFIPNEINFNSHTAQKRQILLHLTHVGDKTNLNGEQEAEDV